MNIRQARNRFTTRLVGLALALPCLLVATAQPGSADALYHLGGGQADAAAWCDRGLHRLSLSIALRKDTAYTWQNIQYAYLFTDVNTGRSTVGPVYTYKVTSLGVETPGSTAFVPSAAVRISYTVRFGAASGYGPWSAWTPVYTVTTWPAKRWFQQPMAICYT